MKRNRSLIFSGLVVLILAATTSAQNSADQLDFGTVSGSVYANNYFGLQLTIPATWRIQGDEVKEIIKQKGKEVLDSSDKDQKLAREASLERTVNLLTVTRYDTATATEFNPSFILGAERLNGTETSSDQYMTGAKNVLLSVKEPPRIEKDTYHKTFGGLDFVVMDTATETVKGLARQRYHVHVKKGYALFFISTYVAEGDLITLNGVLSSLKVR